MRFLLSELAGDPLAAMARYVCPNFAELSDSLGDIAGERVGDWIRDAVVAVMGGQGDAFLDSQWLLEWEGWEDLRATLLTHDAAADADETDTIFRAISRHVRQLFMIATDNQDVPLKSDEDRLQELQLLGFKCGKGMVYGRNDCLADSLLQSMVPTHEIYQCLTCSFLREIHTSLKHAERF